MVYDLELAQRVLSALSAHASLTPDDIVEKPMFGGLSYMVRGAMGVGVLGERLVIRASPDDAERYLTEAHVRPMDFTGKPMKGWLYVDAEAVRDDASMQRWVDRSVTWVLGHAAAKAATKKKPGPKKAAAKKAAAKKPAR